MKYVYVNRNKILPLTKRMEKMRKQINYIYANEEDESRVEYKDLVVEEKPTYDEKTQELYSWFEDSEEVITQKFKIIEKGI